MPDASATTGRTSRTATPSYTPPDPKPRKVQHHPHWLLYVGLGMLIFVAIWAIAAVALQWGTNEYNNIVYGYPRTYQTDAVVGHNDSAKFPTHFIAMNLHKQIVVIELPGGNPANALYYTIGSGLMGSQDDLIPVTLSFGPYNHDNKMDMYIHVAEQDYILCNTGTKFAACSTPGSTPTATP
jgi:hypothetical protein